MDNYRHDLSLIQRCQSGDEEAFKLLVLKYHPLMLSKIKKFYIPSMDIEDLLQECRVVLYQAINKFQPKGNIKFSSFYIYLLQHHLCELLRYYSAYKRCGDHKPNQSVDYQYEDYIFDEFTGVEYSETLDPEKVVEVREQFDIAYETLTDKEKHVFCAQQVNITFTPLDKPMQNALYRSQYKMKQCIRRCK